MQRPSVLLALLAPLSLLALAGCAEEPLLAVDSVDSAEADSAPGQGERMAVVGEPDADGDGYTTTDCDDADATAYPGATEADDLADDDCDGWVDEDFVAAGDIVVTEVNRQARFGAALVNNNGTWVEVYNDSSRTINLANWVFVRGTTSAGDSSLTVDPAVAPILAPGDYAVFCDSDDYQSSPLAAKPLTCDYVWGDEAQISTYAGTYHSNTFYLRATSDTFGLYIEGNRSTGRLVDTLTWTYDAVNGYWPKQLSFSTSLDPAYFDGALNDNEAAWCSTSSTVTGGVIYTTTWRWWDITTLYRDEYGTPGTANFNCLNDPDLDADGYTGATDCDDGDAAVHPGATETCDGVDEDCDGTVDDVTTGNTYYADSDGDTYGDAASTILGCSVPAGYTTDATDCDDADATSFPGGTEVCDAADNNCDGSVDEGLTSGSFTYYADTDADGYGDPANTTLSCTAPGGYTNDATDCDDLDPFYFPGATESDDLGDDDCDGWVDEDFVAAGDIIVTEVNRQARFGAAAVNNNGTWVELYNDSARTIDLSNWVFVRGTTSAGDSSLTVDPAVAPVLTPGDYAVFCDSDDYQSSPLAAKPLTCDYIWGDESQISTYAGTYHSNTFYLQATTDTFGLYIEGNRSTGRLVDTITWTYDAVNGYWPKTLSFSTSLDPANFDSILNNDEVSWCSTSSTVTGTAVYTTTWRWWDITTLFRDEYGTPGVANFDCLTDPDADLDTYAASVDCNDANASIHPGATEVCDGIDQDCDGTADDGAPPTTYYADADSDGYGNLAVTTSSCSAVAGYVSNSTDCNDASATVSPGDAEVCNDGIDNDCDPDPTPCEWSGSEAPSASYDFRGYGTATNYAVGSSIANNGDFNGDGYDDVVVGQSFWDTSPTVDNGRAYIWYGPVTTADTLSSADVTIDGDTARSNDQFGSSSRFIGDLNSDGADDLLLSASKSHSDDRGTAYLFLGGSTPTSATGAYASFAVASATNYTGQSIDGGDIDGDGLPDILVGAYGRTTTAGAVGVWNNTAITGGAEDLSLDATLLVTGEASTDNLGYSAQIIGDLDGDGMQDLLLGAPAASSTTKPGKAYVFYGVNTLSGTVSASLADAVISGSNNGDRFGFAVAGLGDTNGDGQNDFLVTADYADTSATNAGTAYVFTAPPTGAVTGATEAESLITGQAASDFFGRSGAEIGDINGDGFADFAVGASGYDVGALSGAGALYVIYGPAPAGISSAAAYDYRLLGANTSDAVGYATAGGGDVDGDTYADFMASAPSWDGYGYGNAGGSWVFYGRGE